MNINISSLHISFSLVERLPRNNLNLLRHIMCVLHHITTHAASNQMDAYNLSVCIGQSLLWAPITKAQMPGRSPAAQQPSSAKDVACVVQLLIDNCSKIFHPDVTSLFGIVPSGKTRQDSSTDSDSIHSLRSTPDHSCKYLILSLVIIRENVLILKLSYIYEYPYIVIYAISSSSS